MQITLTAKIKIKPTKEQSSLFVQTLEAYRNGCNYVSTRCYQKNIFQASLLHKETYQPLRTRFYLRSQMAQSVLKTVLARYKAIKSSGHKIVQVQFKKAEYDLVWNRDYSLVKGLFSVNTLQGRVKVDYEAQGMNRYLDGSWQFGTAKLIFKHQKWFLHIPMTKEIAEPQVEDPVQVVGVDLGINFIATAYDSQGKTLFFSGKKVKQQRAKYKALRQQLQKKQTPSARRKLKNIGQRENRWMTDVNHQVSKALVTHYGENTLYVLEDLTGIRNATERVRTKDRYMSVSWAFYQLRNMLEYKALLTGSQTLVVDPKYTSQACPTCGHIAKGNRDKAKHVFSCQACGYQSNDDRVGAMNIRHKGRLHVKACSVASAS
jgi:putative transposase